MHLIYHKIQTSNTFLVVSVTTQSISADMCQDNTRAMSLSSTSARCAICEIKKMVKYLTGIETTKKGSVSWQGCKSSTVNWHFRKLMTCLNQWYRPKCFISDGSRPWNCSKCTHRIK